jgi:hypothetical protein
MARQRAGPINFELHWMSVDEVAHEAEVRMEDLNDRARRSYVNHSFGKFK